METKFITLVSFKGGVGKTTCAVCLACLIASLGHSVLLIDSDSNRSASVWASDSETMPFAVATENTATRLMSKQKFDFVIIDTPARPSEEELKEYADSCDLLILVTTPAFFSLSALQMLRDALPKGSKYSVMLNYVPPSNEPDGEIALQALKENEFPVLGTGFSRAKIYEHAQSKGEPIYNIRGGKKIWREQWEVLKTLQPLKDLIVSARS